MVQAVNAVIMRAKARVFVVIAMFPFCGVRVRWMHLFRDDMMKRGKVQVLLITNPLVSVLTLNPCQWAWLSA